MSDDTSITSFEEYLKRAGWEYQRKEIPSAGVFIVEDYLVLNGINAGKKITVGFPIPIDYPTTAPYGLHVKDGHGLQGTIPAANNASPLGSDWKFWSRKMPDWPSGRRNAGYYFDLVNRWLEL